MCHKTTVLWHILNDLDLRGVQLEPQPLGKCNWVLASYRYETLDMLLATLADHVIAPAEQRANEIAPSKRVCAMGS